MDIDAAKQKFDELFPEWHERQKEIETEQDARFQIINRMLTEVLGWEFGEIKTEPATESGFIDYLLSRDGRGRMVVEAKRQSVRLVDTKSDRFSWYMAGGPAVASAREGLDQAKRYCADTAVLFSAVTNGFEWIGFWAVRTDGVPPSEGRVAVFPNLESVRDHFALFFDLFSRDGVMSSLYQVHVHEAEGFQIRHSEQLTPAVKPNEIYLLPKTQVASDMETVFKRFFSTISGDDDPEMLAECFVQSKESREADDNLEKITRSLTNRIDVVEASSGDKLSEEIKQSIESRRGEFVLIVGNKGAGKSTFVDRFFRLVLDQRVRKRCLVLRIDLADSTGDISTIASWLTDRLKNLVELEMFDRKIPTYDELQGVFMQEYDRWRLGERKYLYEQDKVEFKNKFGTWIAETIEKSPDIYLRKLLDSAVSQRRQMPCIVFDNTDHFPQSFQEAVFQYGQSLFRSVFSFVICPITDRTIWQLSKAGPFQSYETRAFYLPVPSTKEVLAKRVNFIRKRTNESEQSGKYFSDKGIRISIKDVDGFAACIEDIFVNEDYVGRIIGWLSNHDIRRSLRVAERIITSPTITIVDLVAAYVGGQPSCPRPRVIKQALVRGQYNRFHEEDSDFIVNLFAVSPKGITSPLLRLSILRLLKDKDSSSGSPSDAYLKVSDIISYFEPSGVTATIIKEHLQALLQRRLVQPYDPTLDLVSDTLLLRVTHAGQIHYEFAFDSDEATYVLEMALTTPMRDPNLVTAIRSALIGPIKLNWEDWRKMCEDFIGYCLHEDFTLMALPKTQAYDGQRIMRTELERKWLRDEHNPVSSL